MNDFQLSVHYGNALNYLATIYATLPEVIHELVQNSIDVNATRITVKVNWKQRMITVRDNGDGVSKQLFSEHMKNIAHSTKKSTDKLGQFGLGFISPFGKCEQFRFTSCAKDTTEYNEWTLVCEKILKSSNSPSIDHRTRPDLKFNPSTGNWWRSELIVDKFTTDSVISAMTIDDLAQSIYDKYNRALLKKKAIVELCFVNANGEEQHKKVQGASYTGIPLETFTYTHSDGKRKTTFTIFKSRKKVTQQRGYTNIHLGRSGDMFRVSFGNFSRAIKNAKESIIENKHLDLLQCGLFEGEIISDVLTLAAKREAFEQNDDFHFEFGQALATWCEQIGFAYAEKQKTASREERYQTLGVNVLKNLEVLLKTPDLDVLYNTQKELAEFGTIGTNHTDRTTNNQTMNGGIAANNAHNNKTKTRKNKAQPPKPSAKEINHTPMVSYGPNGSKRNIVKNNSVGLSFAYDELPDGISDLWSFNREHGLITFNITHNDWQMCDPDGTGDSMIQILQIHIALITLQLESMKDNQSSSMLWIFARQHIKSIAHGLASNTLLPKRKPGQKP